MDRRSENLSRIHKTLMRPYRDASVYWDELVPGTVYRVTKTRDKIEVHVKTEEAMQIADSIALMNAGRIVQTGTPEQLYNHPASLFVARFFCDVNEIAAECRSGQIDTPLGRFLAPSAMADGPCVLCIRPQAITPDPDGVPVEFVSRQFLGHDDRLRLRLPQTGQLIHARLSHTGPLKTGQMLRVGVRPDEVTVFAGA
jgi:iron(III) transport system ATP-binding protein